MITITIGQDERPLEAADEQWLTQQINRRRRDGQAVCVQVAIHDGVLNLVLATPGCSTGSGRRPPNSAEQKIFDLWNQRGLNDANFTAGSLIAFLQQVRRVV